MRISTLIVFVGTVTTCVGGYLAARCFVRELLLRDYDTWPAALTLLAGSLVVAAGVAVAAHKPQPRRQRRQAFTLLELLVVIGIITILAGMTLGMVRSVQQDAAAQRTQAQVAKLDLIVRDIWEGYQSRALAHIRTPADRIQALRQLQRAELPDRITDVTGHPFATGTAPLRLRRYLQRATATWTPQHQGAECLYLIATESRPAPQFNESEIGDVDQDGMKEFIDGFGNPIEFIRWAPALTKRVGPDAIWDTADDIAGSDLSSFQVGAAVDLPDASGDNVTGAPESVDLWLVGRPHAFALFPLIYSAGRDERYGIVCDVANGVPVAADWQSGTRHDYGQPADPYATDFGQALSSDHLDTIHNH